MVGIGAVVVGCSSILGPSGPSVSIQLAHSPASQGEVHLAVSINRDSYLLESSEEIDVDAPGTGSLPVAVSLGNRAGTELASLSFDQLFVDGHLYWIHARIGIIRPLGHCIGQLHVFPLDGLEPDTLFLTHGSIPEDAVC